MSSYKKSKSQKRSQSQSKSGGRRRKRSLKNVRRRKTRKVMRGGETTYSNDEINTAWNASNNKNKIGVLLGKKTIVPIETTESLTDVLNTDPNFNSKINKDPEIIKLLFPPQLSL